MRAKHGEAGWDKQGAQAGHMWVISTLWSRKASARNLRRTSGHDARPAAGPPEPTPSPARVAQPDEGGMFAEPDLRHRRDDPEG